MNYTGAEIEEAIKERRETVWKNWSRLPGHCPICNFEVRMIGAGVATCEECDTSFLYEQCQRIEDEKYQGTS